jgi:hypothetical protein
MTAQLRADAFVGTMAVIAKKIETMDGRLTDGQARLEVRMDQLSDEIAAVKSTMDIKFAVLEENGQIINRKLNALLAHIGVAE